MRLAITKAIALVVMSLGPSFAHMLEAQPRLFVWSPELWRDATVFNAQFWWFAVAGAPIEILAILSTAKPAFLLRATRPNFRLALAGCVGFVLGLALWFSIVAPVNSVLATGVPGPIPENFAAVRLRWETGHLIVASVKPVVLTLVALACVWPARPASRPHG